MKFAFAEEDSVFYAKFTRQEFTVALALLQSLEGHDESSIKKLVTYSEKLSEIIAEDSKPTLKLV